MAAATRRSKFLLDHVCFGVANARSVASAMKVFSAQPKDSGPMAEAVFHQWQMPHSAAVVEAISLEDDSPPESFLKRFLKKGPRVHHMTWIVETLEDLRAARDAAEAAGKQVVGYDEANSEWREFFLFPKTALGLVVQVASSQGAQLAHLKPFPDVSVPEDIPVGWAGSSVIGVATRCHSLDVAHAQWGQLLRGVRCDGPHPGCNGPQTHSHAIYHWPDSPLRLTVDATPPQTNASDDSPPLDGVIAVEVSAPGAPIGQLWNAPDMGTPFVNVGVMPSSSSTSSASGTSRM